MTNFQFPMTNQIIGIKKNFQFSISNFQTIFNFQFCHLYLHLWGSDWKLLWYNLVVGGK
jgi:hypothetical protein